MTDDDSLPDIDLDAWQPPAPPSDLADAVVRRMREPLPVAAHEIGERRGWHRRWAWMTAGAAAAVAAAGFLAFLPRAAQTTGAPPATDGHGDVIAARASQFALGAISAELDAGAELHWQRERGQLTVIQRRGTATWRVGAGETIEIDPGAMGASIEASGASLRVEVQMQINSSDARVVAASAVTAIAVALVTVVVYRGHVGVTSGGQTVNVGAGGMVEVKPGEAPREVTPVARSRPDEPQPGEPVGAALSAENPVPQNVEPSRLEALRIKGDTQIVPDPYTKIAIQAARDERVIANAKLCIDPAGKVTQVRILRSSGYPGYDQKIETEMKSWEYRPFELDGKVMAACTALTFIYKYR